jgi:ribosomal protein S27AE
VTPLELKTAFRVLREEVSALRDRVGALEARPEVTPAQVLDAVRTAHEPVSKDRKLCPHCGEVPAYHFHVVKCAKNKKNKGVNGEANGP